MSTICKACGERVPDEELAGHLTAHGGVSLAEIANAPIVDATEELVVRYADSGGLVNPRTGAVVTEASDDEDVIDMLVVLRDGKKLLDSIDGDLSQWLRERADARESWTLAGGRASMPSNRPSTEWDVQAVMVTLATLVRDGELSDDMARDCIRVKREVDSAMLKAVLAGASPAAARAINACKVKVPKTSRRVSVS